MGLLGVPIRNAIWLVSQPAAPIPSLGKYEIRLSLLVSHDIFTFTNEDH